MIAGKLDRRIILRMPAAGAPDGFGDGPSGFVDVATVWASVQFVRDSERMRSAELSATITHRFQVRHSSQVAGVDARGQIVFDGQTYHIVAPPKEIGRREGIEFSATAQPVSA